MVNKVIASALVHSLYHNAFVNESDLPERVSKTDVENYVAVNVNVEAGEPIDQGWIYVWANRLWSAYQ